MSLAKTDANATSEKKTVSHAVAIVVRAYDE